jgi:hypothetical protein
VSCAKFFAPPGRYSLQWLSRTPPLRRGQRRNSLGKSQKSVLPAFDNVVNGTVTAPASNYAARSVVPGRHGSPGFQRGRRVCGLARRRRVSPFKCGRLVLPRQRPIVLPDARALVLVLVSQAIGALMRSLDLEPPKQMLKLAAFGSALRYRLLKR